MRHCGRSSLHGARILARLREWKSLTQPPISTSTNWPETKSSLHLATPAQPHPIEAWDLYRALPFENEFSPRNTLSHWRGGQRRRPALVMGRMPYLMMT